MALRQFGPPREVTREQALRELFGLLERLLAHDVLRASDTPYHFGSQDLQWNGAWGIVRVRQPAQRIRKLNELIAEVEKFAQGLRGGRGVINGTLTPEAAQRLRDLTLPSIDDLLDQPAINPAGPVALPPPLGSEATLPLPPGAPLPLPRDLI